MASHLNKLLFSLVIWNLLNNAAGISTTSDKDEDRDATITRVCKPVTECTFYTDLIKLQKARSPFTVTNPVYLQQEMISGELKRQNCGWENDLNPKGNMKTFLYLNATT